MKQIATLALSLIITIGYSQTTIFNEVFNSSGLAIEGDNLYIAAIFDNSIYKLDWTESNPTASVLVDNIDKPNDIAIYDDYLYACLNSNNSSGDRIVRIDLTASDPIAEDFVVISNPTGIVFRNNEMYVNSGSSIYYIDTDSNNPTPLEIINDLEVSVFGTIGVCIAENYLFVSEGDGIVKYNIDLTNPIREIVATGLKYVQGITNYKDEKLLFVSYSPDMIYELDIVSGVYSSLFPSNLITPFDIITSSNNLIFVSNIEGGEVNKIDAGTLSAEDLDSQNLFIYPNPTSDFVNIQYAEEFNKAVIFNGLGQKVHEVEMKGDANIDIRNLPKGVYFLKIESQNLTKFIKE